jgi:hypothetical protein
MNEFARIVAAAKMWGWGRTSLLVALLLLAKQLVTFDQAVVLILLTVLLERFAFCEGLSSRRQGPKSSSVRSAAAHGNAASSRRPAGRSQTSTAKMPSS